MASIAQLLAFKNTLQAVSDTPGLDVEILLGHCLQQSRTYLKTWPERAVSDDQQQAFMQLLLRRQLGEPVAYLIGERDFWKLRLQVSCATLIPRPETELLVEQALKQLAGQQQAEVLDLGTGTGAVALALASEQPGWNVLAVDRQTEAVALAECNRSMLQLANVQVQQSDWFQSIPASGFDLIVSNPPYIDGDDPHLDQGDVRFEPRSALVANRHGMADIEHIVALAPGYLAHQGWLLFEHGYDQAGLARQALDVAGFEQVFSTRDLAGHQRVSGGCFNHSPD